MDSLSFVLSDPKDDLIDLKWSPILIIMWGQNWSTCFLKIINAYQSRH